ncbi:hypothetical protein M9H77_18118 [Catharanthus roseus]|uniref:Uncharacterized protein n=1 Tax=Catharanthus roseus TaxID=4058 RepID=A0ACC0B6K3_CATRO|nr:hypothetical protein M9H77_18118 [Catharanthus roseus]
MLRKLPTDDGRFPPHRPLRSRNRKRALKKTYVLRNYVWRKCVNWRYMWMYPFDKYLNHLEKKTKNKARVEGSMCSTYFVEEATTIYSNYFEPHVSTKARDPLRNDKEVHNEIEDAFSKFNRRWMIYPVDASSRESLKNLSWGRTKLVKSCNGYFVKSCYNGILNKIVEFGYLGRPSPKVVLFKCDWFDSSLHQGLKIHDK